jgi:sialate O-acetylesterase
MLDVDKTRALLAGWHELWGYDFPFYFVQIAPYQYGSEPDTRLPEFWEAQAEIVKTIPKTGMAVVTDCTLLNDIHPTNKEAPGTRLALLAEANTYGMDVVSTGPVFQSLEKKGDKLTVKFDSAKGLTTRDGKAPDWFEIAGADGIFKSATAKIKGDRVILSSPDIAEPTAMRFGWGKLAAPNLMNAAGLPCGAFRAQL